MTHAQYVIAVLLATAAAMQLITYMAPTSRFRDGLMVTFGVIGLLALLHRVSLAAPSGGMLHHPTKSHIGASRRH